MRDITNTRDPFLRTPPGSPQALKRGCTCFPAENRFGFGRWEPGSKHPIFIVDTECPLHGINAMLELTGIDGWMLGPNRERVQARAIDDGDQNRRTEPADDTGR